MTLVLRTKPLLARARVPCRLLSRAHPAGTAWRGLSTAMSHDQARLAVRNANLDSKGWSISGGENGSPLAIEKSFLFEDFITAFGFMSQTAIVSECMQHHPEWFNVYNRVDVRLTTHDAQGLTEKDLSLASKMESFAK